MNLALLTSLLTLASFLGLRRRIKKALLVALVVVVCATSFLWVAASHGYPLQSALFDPLAKVAESIRLSPFDEGFLQNEDFGKDLLEGGASKEFWVVYRADCGDCAAAFRVIDNPSVGWISSRCAAGKYLVDALAIGDVPSYLKVTPEGLSSSSLPEILASV